MQSNYKYMKYKSKINAFCNYNDISAVNHPISYPEIKNYYHNLKIQIGKGLDDINKRITDYVSEFENNRNDKKDLYLKYVELVKFIYTNDILMKDKFKYMIDLYNLTFGKNNHLNNSIDTPFDFNQFSKKSDTTSDDSLHSVLPVNLMLFSLLIMMQKYYIEQNSDTKTRLFEVITNHPIFDNVENKSIKQYFSAFNANGFMDANYDYISVFDRNQFKIVNKKFVIIDNGKHIIGKILQNIGEASENLVYKFQAYYIDVANIHINSLNMCNPVGVESGKFNNIFIMRFSKRKTIPPYPFDNNDPMNQPIIQIINNLICTETINNGAYFISIWTYNGEIITRVDITPAMKQQILDDIKLLNNANYCHNDLKSDNITYCNTTGKITFIDLDKMKRKKPEEICEKDMQYYDFINKNKDVTDEREIDPFAF